MPPQELPRPTPVFDVLITTVYQARIASTPTPTAIDTTPRAMPTAAVGVFLVPGVACDRATRPAATAATPMPIPMTSQLVTSASAPRINEAMFHFFDGRLATSSSTRRMPATRDPVPRHVWRLRPRRRITEPAPRARPGPWAAGSAQLLPWSRPVARRFRRGLGGFLKESWKILDGFLERLAAANGTIRAWTRRTVALR
jgi:hypothetical protein